MYFKLPAIFSLWTGVFYLHKTHAMCFTGENNCTQLLPTSQPFFLSSEKLGIPQLLDYLRISVVGSRRHRSLLNISAQDPTYLPSGESLQRLEEVKGKTIALHWNGDACAGDDGATGCRVGPTNPLTQWAVSECEQGVRVTSTAGHSYSHRSRQCSSLYIDFISYFSPYFLFRIFFS